MFIQELNKKVKEASKVKEEDRKDVRKEVKKTSFKEDSKTKSITKSVDFVVGGAEKPFVPILDPKAHALTGKTSL